jgi:hypothetical protein
MARAINAKPSSRRDLPGSWRHHTATAAVIAGTVMSTSPG